MISWPDSLVTELAERRAIIFFGAGASVGCSPQIGSDRLPDWKDLLLRMKSELIKDVKDQAEIDALIARERYLDAAQIVRDEALAPEFSRLIKRVFVQPKYLASPIHKVIYDIDPKIVITPNYDDAYETYAKRFGGSLSHNVALYYDEHALNDVRSPTRVILKMHGSISNPDRLILSRSDYYKARREHSSYYALLDALFLTSTVLFIGTGLSDPDVQLVLENVNLSTPSTNSHYAVVSAGRHTSEVKALKQTANIHLFQYAAGVHGEALTALEELRDAVVNERALKVTP